MSGAMPSGSECTTYGRPDTSTAARASVSSSGTTASPNRLMPALSPRASRSACPRVIAVSSTVWCASISVSPSAATARSSRPCLASCASIWSKNGTPVLTLAVPVPSRSSSTTTEVSLVTRSRRADLIALPPSRALRSGRAGGAPDSRVGGGSSAPGRRNAVAAFGPAPAASWACLLAGARQRGQQRGAERVHLGRGAGGHPQPAGRAGLPDQHPPLQQGLPYRVRVTEPAEQHEVRVRVRHREPLA